MIILIDSGILGRLTSPNSVADTGAFKKWFDLSLIRTNVVSSKICHYEIRRGLLLAQKQGLTADGLSNLDEFHQVIDFLPVTETILDLAADIRATANQPPELTAGHISVKVS
jgi:predicted nucleic acid-binding protein